MISIVSLIDELWIDLNSVLKLNLLKANFYYTFVLECKMQTNLGSQNVSFSLYFKYT